MYAIRSYYGPFGSDKTCRRPTKLPGSRQLHYRQALVGGDFLEAICHSGVAGERLAFEPVEVGTLIIRILEDVLNNGVVASKDLLLREADRGIILQTVIV